MTAAWAAQIMGRMEERIEKLESDLAAMKIDLGILKANSATKSDIAEVKAETKTAISEAKTSIILWVVGAVILGQILPAILRAFA